MSKEKTHPGLTAEQSERAIQLKTKLEAKSKAHQLAKREADDYLNPRTTPDGFRHKPSAVVLLGHDAEKGYKAVAHAVAKRQVKTHYNKHEAAYQEQALIEAREAGKHIVGWALEGETEQPLVGTLKYDLVGREGVKTMVMPLVGDLETAQDTALNEVLAAEWGPHMDTVYSPVVTLPDGTSQPWQAFTAPALERQRAAEHQPIQ